jgi:hypothetical protein
MLLPFTLAKHPPKDFSRFARQLEHSKTLAPFSLQDYPLGNCSDVKYLSKVFDFFLGGDLNTLNPKP